MIAQFSPTGNLRASSLCGIRLACLDERCLGGNFGPVLQVRRRWLEESLSSDVDVGDCRFQSCAQLPHVVIRPEVHEEQSRLVVQHVMPALPVLPKPSHPRASAGFTSTPSSVTQIAARQSHPIDAARHRGAAFAQRATDLRIARTSSICVKLSWVTSCGLRVAPSGRTAARMVSHRAIEWHRRVSRPAKYRAPERRRTERRRRTIRFARRAR